MARKLKDKPPVNHSTDLLDQARQGVRRGCRYVVQLGINPNDVEWPGLTNRSITDPRWKILRSDVKRATSIKALVMEGVYDPDSDTVNVTRIRELSTSSQ